MKAKKIMALFATVATLALTMGAQAQPQMGKPVDRQNVEKPNQCRKEFRGQCQMAFDNLNLSEDQKTKIKSIRINHQKEMMKLRAKKQELQAHLNVLRTADVADMKAINATIDEITQNQNQMMKSQESFIQQIRVLLTDEQRVEFDMHKAMRRGYRGRNHRLQNDMPCMQMPEPMPEK